MKIKKVKGITGIKKIGGEYFKFINGVTYLGKLKFTLAEVKEALLINENDFPLSEGW